MYVYRSSNDSAVFTPTIPDVEHYWEVNDLPPGEGPIQITEDGELYRLGAPSQPAFKPTPDASELIIDSLLN